jgi:mono/diheme cytochrome c family protein
MHVITKMRGATAAFYAAGLIAATSGPGAAETLVERGAYLVTTIGACGNCHTPRDKTGHAIPGMALAGGFEFDDGPIGHVVGPNITPDPETGIGKWTEAQIVTALRDGKRPDDTIIGPPMPIPAYRQLSDRDAAAIAAYLRSLKPIRHAVARTSYKMPLPPAYGPAVTQVDEPLRADKIAYGGYLAGPAGHCVLCHTPLGDGKPFDMAGPLRAVANCRILVNRGRRRSAATSPAILSTASASGATHRSSARSLPAGARMGRH